MVASSHPEALTSLEIAPLSRFWVRMESPDKMSTRIVRDVADLKNGPVLARIGAFPNVLGQLKAEKINFNMEARALDEF
jgi:hypothetical protein